MQNRTTEKTREALFDDVGKLKRNAAQIAEDVRDHASAHVHETKQRVTDAVQTVRENLTANPLALIGIGFALGVLLGFRFRR